MKKTWRVGIAGLGTVGQGVVTILEREAKTLAQRTGVHFEIAAVNARDRHKERDIDLAHYVWEDNPLALAARTDIDVVIELIGGADGIALELVKTALSNKKHVITANKALLAYHGRTLALLAEEHGVTLRYEAAVGGGIPVIKLLGEGLAGNRITRISGILNGTCNYMLSHMESTKMSYHKVLARARALGYLEADPTLDVGGIDAAHKLAVLAALGFGVGPNFDAVEITGIENVSLLDIETAARFGCKIRLVAFCERTRDGIIQVVAPALLKQDNPLALCTGSTNMVRIDGNSVRQIVVQGPGAGRKETASAVVGDLCDLARNLRMPVFGIPAKKLGVIKPLRHEVREPYYIRMTFEDKIGVLAHVTAIFAEFKISIDELRQLEHSGPGVPVIVITHETTRRRIDEAISKIAKLPMSLEKPVAMRIDQD